MNAVIKEKTTKDRHQLIRVRARHLQLRLWNERHELWTNGHEMTPIDVLQPGVAIAMHNYAMETREFIGEVWDRGRHVEVAGQLDRSKRKVLISSRYPRVVQNFTAAHELAHLLLHPNLDVMHRDLPVDGPGWQRSWEEREADLFASEFLMPEKRVKKEFAGRFGEDVFVLTDDSAFALCQTSANNVMLRCRCPRDLSALLAKATSFAGHHFVSLAKTFSVSDKAMAIRLDELGLVARW